MKRTFSFRGPLVIGSGLAFIAVNYGLLRLAYGLFLPDVQAELGFDDAVAGLISSGGSLGYALAAVAALLFGDRRPRTVAVAAGAFALVGAAGMAASPSTAPFAVFAIIGSSAAGLASPALVGIVRGVVSAERTDSAQSVVNSGTGVGVVAAGLLALVTPGWREAWVVAAVVTVVVLALLLTGARGTTALAGTVHLDIPWLRSLVVPGVAAVAMGAGTAVVWTYGRSHLVSAGLSETASIVAWICLGVGGAVAALTAGVLGRRTPRGAWALTVVVAGAGSAALGLAASLPVVPLIACAVFGWSYTAATGALIAWAGRLDASRSAAGTAVLFVALVLGQSLGSAVAGGVTALVGIPAVFVGAGVLTAAAAVVSIRRR